MIEAFNKKPSKKRLTETVSKLQDELKAAQVKLKEKDQMLANYDAATDKREKENRAQVEGLE